MWWKNKDSWSIHDISAVLRISSFRLKEMSKSILIHIDYSTSQTQNEWKHTFDNGDNEQTGDSPTVRCDGANMWSISHG